MLALEEALLRHDPTRSNWLLTADGPENPTVILGLSGKPEKLLDLRRCLDGEGGGEGAAGDGVTVVRRFTGGGTVVLGPGTCLCSLVMRGWPAGSATGLLPPPTAAAAATMAAAVATATTSTLPLVSGTPQRPQAVMVDPRAIMAWSESVYRPALELLVGEGGGGFRARENDYVLGDLKFGGNAQAVTRGDWVHHTSFLWDLDPKHMRLLLNPEKQPEYRQKRSHLDFLTTLRSKHLDHIGRLHNPQNSSSLHPHGGGGGSAGVGSGGAGVEKLNGDGGDTDAAPFWRAVDAAAHTAFDVEEVALEDVVSVDAPLHQSLVGAGFHEGLSGWITSNDTTNHHHSGNSAKEWSLSSGGGGGDGSGGGFGGRGGGVRGKVPRGARTVVLTADELRSKHLPLQDEILRETAAAAAAAGKKS